MPHDIFISYAHQDKLTAELVCSTLEANGVACWIAPRDVTPGSRWATEIVDAIEGTKIFLLVFSSSTLSSDHVMREIVCAVENNTRILPLRLENVKPTGQFAFYLSPLHWQGLIGEPLGAQLISLVEAVYSILGRGSLPTLSLPDASAGTTTRSANEGELPAPALQEPTSVEPHIQTALESERTPGPFRSRHGETRYGKNKAINLGILRSGDLKYTENICDGLKAALRNRGFDIYSDNQAGPTEPQSTARSGALWCEKVQILMNSKVPWDCYVAVGTQASIAMAREWSKTNGSTPFLFLGVTDPVQTGLVRALTNRHNEKNVGGVAFGNGVANLVTLANHIIPRRKLIYIYQEGHPQDDRMGEVLKAHPLYAQGILEIIATLTLPTLADMQDQTAVYLGYYTFESLFHDLSGEDLFTNRIIIATHRNHIEHKGLAVAEISADDTEIGQRGAELLIDNVLSDRSLGTADVILPEFYYRINVATAKTWNIDFTEETIKNARDVYGR